jgi:hypothetical protein
MRDRLLTGILVVLAFTLGIVLFVSNRSVSQLMEAASELISDALG